MSINRDMKKYVLEHKETARTPSGALREEWRRVKEIMAAVYKKNDMRVVSSEKYMKSTHSGLTHCKEIKADEYRLIRNGTVYEITDCNTEGRLTNLLLKVVE